jgi:hypothetical protein
MAAMDSLFRRAGTAGRWIAANVAIAGVLAFAMASPPATAAASQPGPQPFSPQARVGFKSGDDWEPSITSDRFGHTYVLYKHFDVTGGGTCYRCDIHLLIQRSSDDGATWTAPRAVAPIPTNGGQFDPQIVVDPIDGKTVWVSFLQDDNSRIAVSHSTDFGQTWTHPTIVSGPTLGFDKDTLVVRGKTVAVAYDDGFSSFASITTDGGKHWSMHTILPGSDVFDVPLSAGGGIDSQGRIFFTFESWDAAHADNGDGPVTLWVVRSTDEGAHWTRKVIDVSGAPFPCTDCGFAFLSAQMAMRIGPDDAVYLLWNGTAGATDFAPERIFFARSTDHGSTYSARRQVSTASAGTEHSFPALAVGTTAGDLRLAWMDTRSGAWQVYYRASVDGGTHLSSTVRISSFVPGYDYLGHNGFVLPYGDYMALSVDDDGRTQAAFGEGPSYAGPGNIWVSHQLGQ